MDWWKRISTGQNLMKVYVPWCFYIYDRGWGHDQYMEFTMVHYDEFIAFITRKKLDGDYYEPKR